jgi:hypothetical protein
MEDDFGASNRRMHSLVAPKVSLDDLDVTVETVQVPAIPAREVVEYAYRIASPHKHSNGVRADEPPAPSHERDAAHADILGAK